MTDPERIEALIAGLKAACVGHPNARIRWPHRLLHEAIEQLRADHPAGAVQRPAPDDEWVASFWKVVCENNRKLEALMAEYRIERGDPPLADHPAQGERAPAEQGGGGAGLSDGEWRNRTKHDLANHAPLHSDADPSADPSEKCGLPPQVSRCSASDDRGGSPSLNPTPTIPAQAKAVERAAEHHRQVAEHLREIGVTQATNNTADSQAASALAAAAETLAAVPGVEALLADWVEGWNGFSEAEIRRRTDRVTFNRIMKTRAALRVLAGER